MPAAKRSASGAQAERKRSAPLSAPMARSSGALLLVFMPGCVASCIKGGFPVSEKYV